METLDRVIEEARKVILVAWTDRFGRIHNHPNVLALEEALVAHAQAENEAAKAPKVAGSQ